MSDLDRSYTRRGVTSQGTLNTERVRTLTPVLNQKAKSFVLQNIPERAPRRAVRLV